MKKEERMTALFKPQLNRIFSGEKGMTFIELMIAVTILSVMVVMATQGVGYIRDQNLTAATRELMADFQKTRQDAMTRSTPQGGSLALNRGFGIRFASNASYVTFEFIETGGGNFQYDGAAEESSPVTKTLPGLVTVTNGAATDPTGDLLIYDRRGIRRKSDLTIETATTVYVLSIPNSSSRPKCISIDAVRIREGSWNGANCLLS